MLLIPMDMPKNCDSCPFFDDIYTRMDGDDMYYCNLSGGLTYWQYAGETEKDCPLVELEENRMYCLKDGVVYMSNAIIQRGKTVRIPAYVDIDVSEATE